MKSEELDLSGVFKKLDWPKIVLLLILMFGFYIRFYHHDYPVVGYHNWKETHYLTEARNFAKDGFFKYGFFIPARDLLAMDDDPSGAHADTFPTISIILGLFFMVFGTSLSIARGVGILFSIGAVAGMYFFVKRLFGREDFALTAAALAAINPLWVFFSHNTQLDNPAIFFMVWSGYFFVGFYEDFNTRDMIMTTLLMTLATLTKYNFILFGFPMLVLVAQKMLQSPKKHSQELIRRNLKGLLISALIASTILIWLFYTYGIKEIYAGEGSETSDASFALINAIRLETIFSENFWPMISSFTADNFTFLGVYMAIIGLVLVIIFYKKGLGTKFTFWYFIGSVLWFWIMTYKLSGHNYHMFPLAPLFFLLVSYMFVVVGSNIANLVRIPHVKWVVIIFLTLLLYKESVASTNRMFDTQFPGLDIAGDYIREHSSSQEKIFHSSHQSYGVLWHADRRGYKAAGDVDYIKRGESLGVTWYFAYAWHLPGLLGNDAAWSYVQQNYEPVQMAYTIDGNQPQLLYILFRKGGSFNGTDVNAFVQGFAQTAPPLIKNYEYSIGTQPVYYISA
jgi:4-amino-4-deoxy-L-arabinose transferase-like glycosyltransferase